MHPPLADSIRRINPISSGQRDERAIEHARAEKDAAAIKFVRALMEEDEASEKYSRPLFELIGFGSGFKKRGPKKETNYFRDQDIAHAIWELHRFGYTPYRERETRNRAAGRRESACSIVGKVLKERRRERSEAAIESIWRRLGPRVGAP